jgi:glycosyltransferase involved in cell wall biosynthesis
MAVAKFVAKIKTTIRYTKDMISACFIIKNEEKWLSGCLENIRAIASEIIVVDTGSTDRSKEIAKSFGAKVFDFKWVNDFSAARNFAISHATQNWILNFDADERIRAEDALQVLELIKTQNVDAYSFKIRNYAPNSTQTHFSPCTGEYPEFEKGHVGYFETQRIKLFRNHCGIYFVGAVHELVESTVKGQTEFCAIPVHHFGELPDEKIRKNKQSTYFPIVADKAAKNPADWKAQFELGAEYVATREFDAAGKCFESALRLSNHATIYSHLGHCYFVTGRAPEAEKTFKAGMDLHPEDHDIAFNFATMRIAQNNFREAAQILEPLVFKFGDSYLANRALGYCYLNMEKLSDAQSYLQRSLQIFPHYEDAIVDMGILRFFQGNRKGAIEEANRTLELFPESARAQGLLKAIAAHS